MPSLQPVQTDVHSTGDNISQWFCFSFYFPLLFTIWVSLPVSPVLNNLTYSEITAGAPEINNDCNIHI